MNYRTAQALWNDLDEIIQWSAEVGINLLEDEFISNAHSHPERTQYDTTSKAIWRAWGIIRSYTETPANVVLE